MLIKNEEIIMRLKTLFTGCVFWILVAMLSLAISNVALAGNYLGELKWSVTPDEGNSSEILVTGITYIGDNYLSGIPRAFRWRWDNSM